MFFWKDKAKKKVVGAEAVPQPVKEKNKAPQLSYEMVAYACTLIERDVAEGVFRVAGRAHVVADLVCHFVTPDEVSDLIAHSPEEVSVFDIATALKRYFRDQQQPLISAQQTEDMRQALLRKDFGGFQQYVQTLEPELHRKCLARMVICLQRLSTNPEVKMDAANLGIVVSPSLFQEVLDFTVANTHAFLLETMVTKCDELFQTTASQVSQEEAAAQQKSRRANRLSTRDVSGLRQAEASAHPLSQLRAQQQMSAEATSKIPEPGRAPDLPVGWEQHVDVKCGVFYFNTTTNRTQFEKPVVRPIPPPKHHTAKVAYAQ